MLRKFQKKKKKKTFGGIYTFSNKMDNNNLPTNQNGFVFGFNQ